MHRGAAAAAGKPVAFFLYQVIDRFRPPVADTQRGLAQCALAKAGRPVRSLMEHAQLPERVAEA